MHTRPTRRPGRTCAASLHLAVVIAAATIAIATSACSRKDDAVPLATPSVMLPADKVFAGRATNVVYRFSVSPTAPAFTEDYTVFVHAIDEHGKRLWTSDHEPPTPTRQWKPGSVIEYTRPMHVPRQAPEGRVQIKVGLYSLRSRDRLPLAGENDGKRAYRVGAFTVVAQSQTATMFVDGWYDAEAPEDAQAEWRWSRGTATVWLRNPKQDTTLVLDLDQPANAFTGPQHVTVRNGSAVVDSFDLPQGKREVRRVRIPASDLGDDGMVHLTVDVDKTFVPAKLPNGGRDSRELGVRVFDVFLDTNTNP